MTSPSVAIIDYDVGNVTSVLNALKRLGVPATVTADPGGIAAASHLILPGVGSFSEGMKGIEARGLVPVLREEALGKKKPLLGICLGMQLLASDGFEHGHHTGLGFIPGSVRRIETGASGLRLPHIGWNNVHVRPGHPIAEGFEREPVFYFVHSFCFAPGDPRAVAGTCEYGEDIVALIQAGNICGAQFHPEKSNEDGLQVFRNFLAM